MNFADVGAQVHSAVDLRFHIIVHPGVYAGGIIGAGAHAVDNFTVHAFQQLMHAS